MKRFKEYFIGGFVVLSFFCLLAFDAVNRNLQPVYTNPVSDISTYRVLVSSFTGTQVCFNGGYYKIKNEDPTYNIYIGTSSSVVASTSTAGLIGYGIGVSTSSNCVFEINSKNSLYIRTSSTVGSSTVTVFYGSY